MVKFNFNHLKLDEAWDWADICNLSVAQVKYDPTQTRLIFSRLGLNKPARVAPIILAAYKTLSNQHGCLVGVMHPTYLTKKILPFQQQAREYHIASPNGKGKYIYIYISNDEKGRSCVVLEKLMITNKHH